MNDEIQPTSFPIPEMPEDMPTREELEASSALRLMYDRMIYGTSFTKGGKRIDPNDVDASHG